MIDLPADIEDRAAYPLVDQQDRWMFNKLTLAERFGYECGPSGTPMTIPGVYCIRPVMNCAGNGHGGVMRFDFDGVTQPPYAPGYFWCEWFNGVQSWTDFTDDLPVLQCYETSFVDRRMDLAVRTSGYTIAVPPRLQLKSKHLVIEAIGNKIIEVAPRHMTFQYPHGDAHMKQFRAMPPWGEDGRKWFYWRTLPN